jgi:release factor glutamine methyltransferase
MTITDALSWAKSKLDEPNDAYYLLCHILGKSRTYLYTWPDTSLSPEQREHYQTAVLKREQGEPVAYILGTKSFWTLDLKTSEHTLIPRPETEGLVEAALNIGDANSAYTVCDLGTGTGAIALALASERPRWAITGVDRIPEAVQLAQENAKRLGLGHVNFKQSFWFSQLQQDKFDLIVSNPPYVETNSPYLVEGDVRFEPQSALTSGDDGLDDIRYIVEHTPTYLKSNGWLMLEHGFEQHQAVAKIMENADFVDIQALEDLNRYQRITIGKLNKERE